MTLQHCQLSPALKFAQLTAAGPGPIEWLWDGYISRRSVTLMTSRWKSGKTTLLSLLLARMVHGGELAGSTVAPGAAVIVSEESPQLWAERGQKLDFGPNHSWQCRPFCRKPTIEQWHQLIDQVIELHGREPIVLAVIDPLASFLPGQDENSATAMIDALAPFGQLLNRGVGVLLLHHPRKRGMTLEPRGSGALTSMADVLIEFDRSHASGVSDRRRWLRAVSRFENTPAERLIELNEAGTEYLVIDSVASDFEEGWQILKTVFEDAMMKLTREGVAKNWPSDHLKPHKTTLWRWLERAVELKLIERGGRGRCHDPFTYWLRDREKWFLPDLSPLEFPHGNTPPEADIPVAKEIVRRYKRRKAEHKRQETGEPGA